MIFIMKMLKLVTGTTKDGEFVGLECKTASPYVAKQWEDGMVPPQYLAQCYHYMAVLNAKSWYIAVVIYGREFKFIKIERDEDVIQNLIKIESDFWKNHVMPQVMPEPDGSDAAERFISMRFAKASKEMTMPLLGFDEKLKRREEIAELMDKLSVEKKQIEQEIKVYMKDSEIAENEHFLVSWKNSISNRLDSARLKSEMPEIYEKFLKSIQSRRFIVREV